MAMRNYKFQIYLIVALLSAFVAHAQPWSGIIDSPRATDWSAAGVTGGIPERTTICSTLNPGATTSQINSAIAACSSGQVVRLTAGTYSGLGQIVFANKSGVTLRGDGADQTKLVFSSTSGCGGPQAAICVRNDGTLIGTTATWSAGYTVGTTDVTLSSVSGLTTNHFIALDQTTDTSDDGTIYVCDAATTCSDEGESGGYRSGRAQTHFARVTAINGSVVTISPALRHPNWSSGKTPQAWWQGAPARDDGIENLSIDLGGNQASAILIYASRDSWVKGVRAIKAHRGHVRLFGSFRCTVRDSYFYDTYAQASESSGIETYLGGDHLIENNIFEHIVAPLYIDGSDNGIVIGYNYSIDNFSSFGQMMGALWFHSAGQAYNLLEGNVGQGLFSDIIHGSHHFNTAFRNRYSGRDGSLTTQTIAVGLAARSRYYNVIGNVLGTSGYHVTYSVNTPSGTSQDTAVYVLGYGNGPPDDTIVASTLMRWGNWDTVTSTNDNDTNDSTGTRFVSGEVPSGLASYANAVPSSQTLPNSFYLSAKPDFWYNPTGATQPAWPPIGPDVANGDLTNTGGHANRIPAQVCYENNMADDSDYSGTTVRVFSAAACYAAAPASGSPAKSGGGARHGGGAKIGDE